MSYLLIL